MLFPATTNILTVDDAFGEAQPKHHVCWNVIDFIYTNHTKCFSEVFQFRVRAMPPYEGQLLAEQHHS